MPGTTHTIRWFGVSDGERIPRNRHMNGRDWGWDAVCSCGFDTRTGGAIQERIREAIEEHRWNAEYCEAHGHIPGSPDSGALNRDKCRSCGARIPVEEGASMG